MLEISVYDAREKKLGGAQGAEFVHLRIEREYLPGDTIRLKLEQGCFYRISLDVGVKSSVVYAKEEGFCFPIPFEEERMPYPPGAFAGTYHILEIEKVNIPKGEVRDLSTNPNDIRGRTALYPHCSASVETRGESIFAARNTIDGWKETDGHGVWPFTSWGDNEDPQARIRIWFGRPVEISKVVIYLRSDFPHDNYWKQGSLGFSDGTMMRISLKQTGEGQIFTIPFIRCEWVEFCQLVKDEENPSLFPALTYWRAEGREALV